MNDICERNIKFGKRLVKERKKAGLTQARLADKIEGETEKRPEQNTISNWENGKSFPGSIDMIFALSRIFACDCGYLLGDYDERTHDSMDICKATGLSEETVNLLCNLRAWGVETELTSVVDALIYDFRSAEKGKDIAPLVYLISWFLQYHGGNSGTMRVLPDGTVKDSGDATGYTSSTLKLNDRIIGNAALTEIEQGLISLKKRILRKERGKNGKH